MLHNEFFVLQQNDPLLSGSPFKGRWMSLEGGTYGGFPIKFLVQVVSKCSHKILKILRRTDTSKSFESYMKVIET